MTGLPHPFDQPYADRDAADLLGAEKEFNRKVVGTIDDVRDGDWSLQVAGLYVKSLGANFDIDTDELGADNGTDILRDAEGTAFVRVISSAAPVRREYDDTDIATGAITIDNAADIAVVDITTNANIVIAAAADRAGRTLTIKKQGAGVPTPVLDGSETLDGRTPSTYAITTDGGYLQLAPGTGGYDILASQL